MLDQNQRGLGTVAKEPEMKHGYKWHIVYDGLQNIYENTLLGLKSSYYDLVNMQFSCSFFWGGVAYHLCALIDSKTGRYNPFSK